MVLLASWPRSSATMPSLPVVTGVWAAIRRDEYAARVLAELHRGLEERRELTRSGEIEKRRAAARAAREAAERA